ncbi:sperm microtubule associated protein 2 like [Centroberyx gerrardi]|uniref:sperm microtubule associated protein 2-like n=1 Tax=Centroberyx gerrardi TaxID=166262 RepID=UPI003AADB5F4
MVSGKGGIQSGFCPSNSEKLSWGDQRPIRPVSASALAAAPTARIQYLARHKRDFSARDDHWRKEEASSFRKTRPPSSKASRYERIVRLSTPRSRSRSSQEAGPPHTPQCEYNCPIWHVDPRVKSAVMTPRLLQLSTPKLSHPDFHSNRSSVESLISCSSKTARTSPRLDQLSLPRLKESNICCELGRPEESIWTVSRAARRSTATLRIESLATPKQLSKDYIPPREPEWIRQNLLPPA